MQLEVDIKTAGYSKKEPSIRDINFTLESGAMVGLLGPNGAGKSTTIKAILGLLPEMAGEIRFSRDRKCGYIPEQPVWYDGLTLWEHLEFAAAVYTIPRDKFLCRADELLKLFRLEKVKHHLPASFSKGMQQKVMLILGFLLEQDVLIVDEPFVGLDPRATKDFLSLLNQARQQGTAVLISTHVLDTAEKICDSFVLLAEGRLVAKGNLEHIRQLAGLPEASLFDCFDRLLGDAAL